ncbi:MAG: DUF4190 domain-containing protein, partial [Verrucomicrobiae bacterium]|nr:DUF4190 domain-containing protein [Verrucomicrobiae bacterium]
ASLLLGLWGFATILLLGIVPAVFGLICGHVALIKIQHSHHRLRGRLAAYAGLVAGYATVLLTPVFAVGLALAYPLLVGNHQQNQERTRLEHASTLYRACEAYARDHGDRYPGSWDQLRGRYLSPADLESLLAGQYDTFPESVKRFLSRLVEGEPKSPDEPAFQLVPHDRPILRELEGSVMVIREIAPPDVERVVVAYDNGETTWLANPNRE